MKKENIYGITYIIPEEPDKKNIDGNEYPKKDQFFRMPLIPEYMNSIALDSDNNPVWTKEQSDYIEREFDRCKFDGYWFMNNGKPTYVSRIHYFYLVFYILENGDKPEYRDTDRRFFYFLEYCLSKPFIKGIARLKKRREGATSQVCAWLLWTAIFFQESKCGIVSKTGNDAHEAYSSMVRRAWMQLPVFFKPESDPFTTKRIVLQKKEKLSDKSRRLEDDEIIIRHGLDNSGHNSSITYKNTALNSYDSGRLTALLVDESAKWQEVSINQYLPIVMKTMEMGARRVGFCILPTSMNEAKKGGRNFRRIWDNSNQFESTNGRTGSGLYRYFVPAYDGLPGFIGKYGESIIGKPTRQQYEWMIKNLSPNDNILPGELKAGAKEYLISQRKIIKDPIALSEEKRMNPFTEEEALYDEETGCYFNNELINNQMVEIVKQNKYIRIGRLYEDENKNVRFADDPNGNWHILKFPKPGHENVSMLNSDGYYAPMFHSEYKMGCDPFRNSRLSGSNKGSNGTILIMSTLDKTDPDNTGMPIAFYRGRPRLKSLFYKEVLMASRLYSCKALIESDVDDWNDFFMENKATPYLRNTPSIVIDRELTEDTKERKRHMKGVKSADPFAINKELEVAQLYVENNCHKIWFMDLLEDLVRYDHENRTKSDLTVAFMMALLDLSSENRFYDHSNTEVFDFIKTYTIGARHPSFAVDANGRIINQ